MSFLEHLIKHLISIHNVPWEKIAAYVITIKINSRSVCNLILQKLD